MLICCHGTPEPYGHCAESYALIKIVPAGQCCHVTQGLFPAPLVEADVNGAVGAKVVERFRLLGRAIAKALQDNRMLDIPLSYIFYRCALLTGCCSAGLVFLF